MKTSVLVLTLIALIVISVVGVYHIPFGLRGVFSEGFQVPIPGVTENTNPMPVPVAEPKPMTEQKAVTDFKPVTDLMPTPRIMSTKPKAKPMSVTSSKVGKTKAPSVSTPENQAMMAEPKPEEFQNASPSMNQSMQLKNAVKEGFRTNYAEVSAGARDQYQPIGAFDGVALPTGNNVSSWRYTSPDEPLLGAPFELGNDSLFMFKNNQCKPSCCGSSLSCSGGCVCTTPDQRQFIAGRGGNRTKPAED